jgi:hypothetical protein
METIRIRMLRRCYIAGVADAAVQGSTVTVSPLTALDLIEAGRAELERETDLAQLLSERRRHVAALLRKAQVGRPFDGAGWRSR